MNVLTITGNLGQDAEVRQAGGTNVLSFGVAMNWGYGERKASCFIDCSLWGKRAEGGLVGYLTKGTPVCVSGELSKEEYNGKTRLKLNVNDVTLMGKGQERSEPAPAPAPEPHQGLDDEIPFN